MQVADIPSIGNLIIAGGIGAVIIMTRSVLSNQKAHGEKLENIASKVTKIEHWAWGPLEDNGVNSTVKQISSDIETLKRKL